MLYTSLMIITGVFVLLSIILFVWKKSNFRINWSTFSRIRLPRNVDNISQQEVLETTANPVSSIDQLNSTFYKQEQKTQTEKQQTITKYYQIKVTRFPEWFDTANLDNELQKESAYRRQFQATQNLLATCLEIDLSFSQLLMYQNGKLDVFFLLYKGNNSKSQLERKIRRLNNLIKINYKGTETEVSTNQNNPFSNLMINEKFLTCALGSTTNGNFVGQYEIDAPICDQLNDYFRTEKKSGMLIISSKPHTQEGIFHSLRKFSENKKHENISSQAIVTENTTDFFKSNSSQKVNYGKQMDLLRSEVNVKRLEAKKIARVNIKLFCIGYGETESIARQDAQENLAIAKASLSPLTRSSSSFPLEFNDYSERLSKHLLSNFYLDKEPYAFELLPDEAAHIFRLPSTDTLPIMREHKTITQIKQTDKDGIALGKIVGANNVLLDPFVQNPKNIVYQSLITGTTGSGKTSTFCAQVIELEKMGIKSLIIDPKGVVFPLLNDFLPDIRVFNFGKESVAPGRCNILECPEWMDVQTQLNLVENILLSVWQIFPPINMILHRALSELYDSDGWSVKNNTHGENRTLEDLRKIIHKIQSSMGYSRETHLDISSAMEMRLNYFMQGQISSQINCQRSIPIKDILGKTTIINLQHANNYAQKVVTLTFLGRLFEYFKKKPTTDDLKHYLVVDEAEHYFGIDQLLLYDDYEKAAAGKAATKKLIEMIAQSRAYGLGIALATQSPTKLPREIMINCNTKIIHKIIDGEDIAFLQKSMRLTEGQANMLPALGVGEALVTNPDNPHPFMIKVGLPIGLDQAGKGVQTDYIENLMREQMRSYTMNNSELFAEENTTKKEVTEESVEKLVQLYLPKTSLLTEDDDRLMQMKSFKKMFSKTMDRVFGKESHNYTEEYRILYLSKFVDIWRRQISKGTQKAAVVEFFDKAFRMHFNYTPEGRDKIMRWIITIVKIWEE